jgi:hypothetical protein
MKDFLREKIKNCSLFENADKIGKSEIHSTYYFLRLKDFEKALDKATADNRNIYCYSYSVGAKMLDDLKEYFYITIHL